MFYTGRKEKLNRNFAESSDSFYPCETTARAAVFIMLMIGSRTIRMRAGTAKPAGMDAAGPHTVKQARSSSIDAEEVK